MKVEAIRTGPAHDEIVLRFIDDGEGTAEILLTIEEACIMLVNIIAYALVRPAVRETQNGWTW